jgi:integrase
VARSINRLSARTVEVITMPGRHADGGGLYLIVDAQRGGTDQPRKPARRWAFIFRWDGRLREMGLGGAASIPLSRARELAAQYRAMLAGNENPIEVRRAEARTQAQAAARTFGELAGEFHEAHRAGWKNKKVVVQWLTSLERYCGAIWPMPVEKIGTDDVLAVLQPIWTAKAETASRVRGRIEAVIDAARARGMIDKDRANPARWKGHLAHLLPKRERLQRGHHAALPYGEVAAFMERLRQRDAMAALCLEFTVLTGARSGEALGARWSEIDLDAALWVISRERTKMGRAHRVPLSDRCVEILLKLEPLKTGPEAYVFPGMKAGQPLSSMSLEMLLRRMQTPVTVHGFRSTFRDWAGDCSSFAREIVEEALAHQVGSEVERSYRRSDSLEKRRQLMRAWADYCSDVRADNVVTLALPAR